ncbi:hypothetical protein J4418_02315 [Candidatus Woesearchaeota archaeon]|nr:hypothetical protein [Candidatus Woesearchaeota archaeon]
MKCILNKLSITIKKETIWLNVPVTILGKNKSKPKNLKKLNNEKSAIITE